MNVNGKNVLITGGSIGIGLELANQFSAMGAKVLICARTELTLQRAKKENPELEIMACDITIPEQVGSLKRRSEELGGIDILINNAAIFRQFNMLENYPLAQQFEEIDINLKALIHLTHIFLKDLMQRKEATIVNLSSPAALVPLTSAPIYSAVKAAVSSYTTSLRHQLRNTHVKVVLLCPPAVDTRMNENNPDMEGMTLMSAEKFAELSIKGLLKGKDEIYVGPIAGLKFINRVVPGMAFRMLNKN